MQAVKGANNSRQGQQASNSFPFFSNDLGQGGSSTVGEVKTRTNSFLIFKFSTFCSTIWIDLLVVFHIFMFQVNISAILNSFQMGYDKRVRPNYGGKFSEHLSHNIYQSNAQQGTNMSLVNRNRSTVSDMASLKPNLFTFL